MEGFFFQTVHMYLQLPTFTTMTVFPCFKPTLTAAAEGKVEPLWKSKRASLESWSTKLIHKSWILLYNRCLVRCLVGCITLACQLKVDQAAGMPWEKTIADIPSGFHPAKLRSRAKICFGIPYSASKICAKLHNAAKLHTFQTAHRKCLQNLSLQQNFGYFKQNLPPTLKFQTDQNNVSLE